MYGTVHTDRSSNFLTAVYYCVRYSTVSEQCCRVQYNPTSGLLACLPPSTTQHTNPPPTPPPLYPPPPPLTTADAERHDFLERTPIAGIMTREVITVGPDETIEDAAKQLYRHRIGTLPGGGAVVRPPGGTPETAHRHTSGGNRGVGGPAARARVRRRGGRAGRVCPQDTNHHARDVNRCEGMRVHGVGATTISRGVIVWNDNTLYTTNGHGKYIPRACFGPVFDGIDTREVARDELKRKVDRQPYTGPVIKL